MNFLHICEGEYCRRKMYRMSISAKEFPNICEEVNQAFQDLLNGFSDIVDWNTTLGGFKGTVHKDSYNWTFTSRSECSQVSQRSSSVVFVFDETLKSCNSWSLQPRFPRLD